MRSAALVLALPVLAGAPAACGGDGYPDKPQQVAKAYMGTNAGSKCRFLTQRLIEALTERQGADARRTCEHNVARVAAPEKVTLRDAEVDGHEAEVEVLRDGAEAKLDLVREGDRWKIAGFAE
jgi:hypothetical protein